MTAAEPLYFEHFAYDPLPWPEHLGHWSWAVQDGMAGRTLASGHAFTRRGALRQQERAVARCEQRAPYTQEPRRPLTDEEIVWINVALDLSGLPVEIERCGDAVVVTPRRALTTEQEVRALNKVIGRTDAPVRWAGMA